MLNVNFFYSKIHNLIASSDADYTFIGLDDRYNDGKFTWLDGGEFNKTGGLYQWKNENSHNTARTADCAAIKSGGDKMINVKCQTNQLNDQLKVRGLCEIERRESE